MLLLPRLGFDRTVTNDSIQLDTELQARYAEERWELARFAWTSAGAFLSNAFDSLCTSFPVRLRRIYAVYTTPLFVVRGVMLPLWATPLLMVKIKHCHLTIAPVDSTE